MELFSTPSFGKFFNEAGLRQSTNIFSANLVADTDTSIAVPTQMVNGVPSSNSKNRYIAVIKTESGKDVFFAINTAASGPAGAAFAATSSELISSEELIRTVDEGNVLHFYSAGATAYVSVSFYQAG